MFINNLMHKIFLVAVLITAIAVFNHSVFAQTEQVQANGITIAYESFGSSDKEAILLIAGWGVQMTMWPNELCEELVQRGYRVIRFDNRDVGLSTHLNSLGRPDWEAILKANNAGKPLPLPYSLADMAKDAIELLSALGIEQAHIVGASMGGHIAQLVAINYPKRTLSLTSISSGTGNPDMPGMTAKVQALPPPPPAGSDIESIIKREILVKKTIGSLAYPTDENLLHEQIRHEVERNYDPISLERQTVAVLFGGDRRVELRKLNVPTMVLHGDADPMVPVENGRDTAANIPNAELRIIPGMGHDIPIALINDFANAITTAASRATSTKAK
jgi:pimeloyl-ACP methyl ester carboxylesterase